MEALRGGRQRPRTGLGRGPRRGARLAAGRLRAAQRRHRPTALDARRPGATGRRPALGCLPRPARAPGRPARRRGPRPGRGTDRRCRPGRRTGSDPTPTRWPTSRSGERPCRSPSTTVARPARRSCRRPPPPTSDGSTGASPATTPRRSRNGANCSTRWPRRSAATSSPRSWPNGSRPCRAPAFRPTSCSAPPRRLTLGRPLPDEHAAAALWWRMARHLSPAVAAQVGDGSHGEGVTTSWAAQLPELLGEERAARIQASTWWPALVSNIDHGLQRGWQLEALLVGRVAALRRLPMRRRRVPGAGVANLDRARTDPRRARARLPLRRAAGGHVGRRRARPGHVGRPPRRHRMAAPARPRGRRRPPGRPARAGRGDRPGRRRPVGGRRRRRGAVRRGRPDAGRVHPRPRRHPARADRRRHPAHVPAGRGVVLLPRHA